MPLDKILVLRWCSRTWRIDPTGQEQRPPSLSLFKNEGAEDNGGTAACYDADAEVGRRGGFIFLSVPDEEIRRSSHT